MNLPFFELSGSLREVGLVLAVLVGFGFGFVLERAGFGRSTKLAAQFYGDDLTVFKVMFGAIVTAMLGAVALDGVGIIDLRALSDFATSGTYLWPMIVGGVLLGIGFIVSGYCPGTSIVAGASGKIDGMLTVVGVVIGTVVYAEIQPSLGAFHTSGNFGYLYLYDLVGVPPAVLAAGVTAMALGCFLGAEKLERIFSRTAAPRPPPRARRVAWAGLGVASAVALFTLLVPVGSAAVTRSPATIRADALAERLFAEPWTLRIVDLRPSEACARERVPGAECVPLDQLAALRLQDAQAARDLVLVWDSDLSQLPPGAAAYGGRVLALEGGFASWRKAALEPPAPPAADASPEERERYRLRAGLHAALTGVPQAPPPPVAPSGAAPPKRKAGGGGCGG